MVISCELTKRNSIISLKSRVKESLLFGGVDMQGELPAQRAICNLWHMYQMEKQLEPRTATYDILFYKYLLCDII